MGTLLYFVLLGGFFFLMMRVGCGSHVMGHGHGEHEGHGAAPPSDSTGRTAWSPPETDIDPVCRMSIETKGARSSMYQGTVYYFCSAEHRDQFEAEPERYVGSHAGNAPKSMEHHHG